MVAEEPLQLSPCFAHQKSVSGRQLSTDIEVSVLFCFFCKTSFLCLLLPLTYFDRALLALTLIDRIDLTLTLSLVPDTLTGSSCVSTPAAAASGILSQQGTLMSDG